MDWYRSCFQPAAVQADFSVNILHNGVEAIDRIRLDWPEARFLLVLRNPVERAYSQFWNARRNHPEAAVPRSFATALSIESFHLQSCYGRQLVPWLEAFPLDRFRFILDHALKNDPAAEVAGLYRWLGLDARWVPPSLEARVNVAHASGPLMRLAKRSAHGLRRHGGARVVRIATSLGLAALVRRMDRRDAVYPPLDPSDALLWWDSLEEDVRLLAEQTGVDVDPWRAQAEAWADAL